MCHRDNWTYHHAATQTRIRPDFILNSCEKADTPRWALCLKYLFKIPAHRVFLGKQQTKNIKDVPELVKNIYVQL